MKISEFKLILEEMKNYNGVNEYVKTVSSQIEGHGASNFMKGSGIRRKYNKFCVVSYQDGYVYTTRFIVNDTGSVDTIEECCTGFEACHVILD